MKGISCLFLALAMAMFLSCGSGSDDDDPIDVTGSWEGSYSSATGLGAGWFEAEIVQNGSSLGGTITVPSAGMTNATLQGTIDGSNMTFGDVSGDIVFTGEADDSNNAHGTYTYAAYDDNGTWGAAKQ